MSDIWKTLADCTEAYDDAKRQASLASRDETAALNKLNDAQKAVDAFIADHKKNAPQDSKWKESERHQHMGRVST